MIFWLSPWTMDRNTCIVWVSWGYIVIVWFCFGASCHFENISSTVLVYSVFLVFFYNWLLGCGLVIRKRCCSKRIGISQKCNTCITRHRSIEVPARTCLCIEEPYGDNDHLNMCVIPYSMSAHCCISKRQLAREDMKMSNKAPNVFLEI